MLADHDYHPLTVVDVITETDDARSLVLDVPQQLAATFAYTAGQFCTFRATVGGEEVVRCYSMSSSPEVGDRFTTTVKRVPGGKMSNWMIDHLRAGDTIDVLRPAGLFVLRDSTAPIVAFAGGSGITPIFSIIKTALATTSRQIVLVYANKNAESVIFAAEVQRLQASSAGRLVVHSHLDSDSGFLDPAACVALVGPHTEADFYVCGPGPYMDTVEKALEILGTPRSHVFIERFVTPGAEPTDHLAETSGTETITFTLKRVQTEVEYQLGETIIETARRGGLKPPSACQGGACGTCAAKLQSGTATMRVNNALTAKEVDDGWVLTCQSIPTSRTLSVNYDA